MENSSITKSIQQFIQHLIESNSSFTVESTEKRRINYEFCVEYNALRILIMIKHIGTDDKFSSKLKLAFFDFLLRYPICLKIILEKNNVSEYFSKAELTSIDKKMVRHISSAWDPDYYNYLGFLEARGLIEVDCQEALELKLTELGKKTAGKVEFPECNATIRRCHLIRNLFAKKTDKEIDQIIHENFAFVVLYDK